MERASTPSLCSPRQASAPLHTSQVAGLRSINQLLLPVRHLGTIDPDVLDSVAEVMTHNETCSQVQDAALALLYSLCTRAVNRPAVAGHAPVVSAMTQALATHGFALPTLRTYVQMFDFLEVRVPEEQLQLQVSGVSRVRVGDWIGGPWQRRRVRAPPRCPPTGLSTHGDSMCPPRMY